MSRPTDPLELYAWLKQEISNLEKELDGIKDEVFSKVDSAGGESDHGTFVIRSYKRPKYKHSEDYDKKNSELKELRAKEIEDGVATVESYSEFVKINFKKAKGAKGD
ncbi:MAG: hypothetical protein AAF456_01100 [Planctomycetota bacterium]